MSIFFVPNIWIDRRTCFYFSSKTMENKGRSLYNVSNENRHGKLFHFVHTKHITQTYGDTYKHLYNLLGSNEILCMLMKCDLVKYATTETVILCCQYKSGVSLCTIVVWRCINETVFKSCWAAGRERIKGLFQRKQIQNNYNYGSKGGNGNAIAAFYKDTHSLFS